jgi:LPS export ABC transporter protein LptC
MRLNKKTTIISIVIICLAAAVIIAVILIRSGSAKPKNILKILPDHVDLQIKDFIYTEVGEANSKVEVKADTAQYYKKQNLALFDKVQIRLTTQDGKVFVMTGDKGRMLTDKKDIEVKGNVVIISETGDRFTTDHLNYTDNGKKFYTDAPVTVESKNMKIKGVGLTLHMNSGELNLTSAVKATLNKQEIK